MRASKEFGKHLKHKQLSEIDEEKTQYSNVTSVQHGVGLETMRNGSNETLGTMMTNTNQSSGGDAARQHRLTAIKEEITESTENMMNNTDPTK